jgi:hypothetical protein
LIHINRTFSKSSNNLLQSNSKFEKLALVALNNLF